MKSKPRYGWVAIGVGLLCATVAVARAESVERVSLAEALQRAQTQSPETVAARLEIAQAEAERTAARLYANPAFSLDTNNIAVGRTTPAGLNVGQTIGGTARVDQPLILWGKRGLRIAAADAGVLAAQEQQRDTMRQLSAAVKDAFSRALHDERVLTFATENRRRYGDIVRLNERRFRSGDISEVEFRKIELENLKLVTAVEEAQRSLAQSQQLLGRLVGTTAPLAPAGELTGPTFRVAAGDLFETALAQRPDVAALRRQRDQAELALRLARRERYPDVTVGADYTRSQFVAAGNIRNTLGFGFSVPLPLLNQNQAEVARAEVTLHQADNELAKARLDIAQEVRDAVTQYESAQRLRQTFESGYLEHAQLSVNAAETAYRIGAASLLELLDAERTYISTQTDYLDTIFAARSGLIALEKAVGTDLAEQ